MTEYDAEQMAAGFRSMTMLTALVRRGGRPAAVAPTIALRAAEKQYGWLPVTVNGGRREIAVVTNLRLIVGGHEIPLRAITAVRPGAVPWSVALEFRGPGRSVCPTEDGGSSGGPAEGLTRGGPAEPLTRGGPGGVLTLSGPWVPWMSVVVCAELYGTAWPPAFAPVTSVPSPRRTREKVCMAGG
ncbi:hypothetical protein [Paractinoplanes brasiliensis]|uniref:Uncharacterized protein n=1 Tax=Paractinoplanes brasiliensis TaxID=52695 RepID=A0A4R6JRL1_9ACTN|nr:hypothetical protein [Actinoplanes brasiliensis]TDO39283.1 hypothetical protein C8E87_2960 [Actinoplanes brasiliensis]